MSRKYRSNVHLRGSYIRYQISTWLRRNKNVGFNVPFLCDQLGLNPDSVNDRRKVYGCILYWRNHFISDYRKEKKAGMFDGMDRHEAFRTAMLNFNRNDAYVFLSKWDRKSRGKYYYQPLSLAELENMDRARLINQWKGLVSVMDEMRLEEADFVLTDGTRTPISNLLDAGKKVDRLLNK